MPIINQVVKGGGSGPAHYIEKTVDANGVLQNGSTIMDFTGVTNVGNKAMQMAYQSNTLITGIVNMSSITILNNEAALSNCFAYCTGITGFNLTNLKKISGSSVLQQTFMNSGLTGTADFSKLEIISGTQALSSICRRTSVTGIDFSSLCYLSGTNVLNWSFGECDGLTQVRFDSLYNFNGGCSSCFNTCNNLTSVSYPALRIVGALGVSGLKDSLFKVPNVTVHFPSNMQSVVEGMTGYSTTTPFGALAGTVLFDLPATNLLTGVNTTVYERNPKYDTQTALAWRVQDTGTVPNLVIDWTPFYTSGLTDPTVGTTIYSDDACTVAVTTVDSIA